MRKKLFGTIAGLFLLGAAAPAAAGGYDTPMLYSARHMGMGGAAVAYVDDPSALFHNPAGLGRIKKISLMGDFSLLAGKIRSSPNPAAPNLDSEPVIAPFFLVGGGFRILKWLTAGVAVYPIASASGAYKYKNAGGSDTEDSTKLVFIEISPGVAANFDAIGLRVGAGYRLTSVSLTRQQIIGGSRALDFEMSGWNVASFRAGVQWDAPKYLKVGITYRHKTTTKVKQDAPYVPWAFGGCAPGSECTAKDGESEFTLPGKLSFGLRGDLANFGAAIDLEYGFYSQNEKSTLAGIKVGSPPCVDNPATEANECTIALDNVFLWENALTLRVGGEYRIALGEKNRVIPRLGFVLDSRTSRKEYPTAFGTPPGPTYVITAGVGFERGPYRANLAYGYRFGSATITDQDLTASGSAHQACPFCSYPGDYKITLNGVYVDFSYDFE
jgi:long-subunit fatty acid transport protein